MNNNNSNRFPDRHHASADELEHRMQLQDKRHNIPIQSVTGMIDGAIEKVLVSLGVNLDFPIPSQQEDLGIIITEHFPEEMGNLSGFYVICGDTPIASIVDPFLGSDGMAYVYINWIQENRQEKFGGVKIVQ